MVLKKLGLVTATLLACTQVAQANDLQINGFLNVSTGIIDNKAIEDSFSTSGYDTTLGFDPQTLAGLQLSKKVNDSTSATVQLMSRGSNDYQTEAAWAYVTFQPDSKTDIRFGRLRTPFFQYSDFLEVGYAYNWITPPGLVYRIGGLSALTGIDITRQFTLGAVDGSLQVYTGRFDGEFNLRGDKYDLELRSAAGAVLTMNAGNFGGRLSYHQAELYMPDVEPGTVRALDELARIGADPRINVSVTPDGETSSFYQGSVFWDNGSTSLNAEYTALRHDSNIFLSDGAWMVSAAQRMGDFTAHLTYALVEDSPKSGNVGVAQKFAEAKESSTTLGLRYDYNSSVAFKTEAHYITYETAADRQVSLVGGGDPVTAGNQDLTKNTGSLYTIGMSIVF